MWHVKHAPQSLDKFIGKTSSEEARKWDGKPVIIHGPVGTGKSTLARLIAAERGWDVVEVSDANVKTAHTIANTGSLFGGCKMLLIEDVDAIRDIKSVGELVGNSASPIIMTTSDYDSKRLTTLKKKCGSIQLRRPLPASIVKHLTQICMSEGVEVEKEVLEKVAKNCSGDLRAAINDIETLAKGRKRVTLADAEGLLPERDREVDIYRALSIIFGGRELAKVVDSTWDLNERPDEVIWWVEENAPKLYTDKKSIDGVYRNLSRADVFLGRIAHRQYWGFLRYANTLMTAGVNVNRPEKINFAQYSFPGYYAAMGRTKAARNMEQSIASRMKPDLHVSYRVFRREYVQLYRTLLRSNRVDAAELKEHYKLDDEEMEYLTATQ